MFPVVAKWLLIAALLAGCNRKPVPPPEPTYQGKPRSEWVRLAKDASPQTRRKACEALDAMGGYENLDSQTKAVLDTWHAQQLANQRDESRRVLMAADQQIFRQQRALNQPHISLPFDREDDWDAMDKASNFASDPATATKAVALIRQIAAHDRLWWKRVKMEPTIKSLGKSAAALKPDLEAAWSFGSSDEDRARLFELIKSVRNN
jgi:hypothetical protein